MVSADVPLDRGPIMVGSPEKHIKDNSTLQGQLYSSSKDFASSRGKARTGMGGERSSRAGSSPAPTTMPPRDSPGGIPGLTWVWFFLTLNSSIRNNKEEEMKNARGGFSRLQPLTMLLVFTTPPELGSHFVQCPIAAAPNFAHTLQEETLSPLRT